MIVCERIRNKEYTRRDYVSVLLTDRSYKSRLLSLQKTHAPSAVYPAADCREQQRYQLTYPLPGNLFCQPVLTTRHQPMCPLATRRLTSYPDRPSDETLRHCAR